VAASARPSGPDRTDPIDTLRPLPPEGLYVHVPFCVSHCPYCDFVVYAGAVARGPTARVAELIGALHRELELRSDLLDDRFGGRSARSDLESFYIGGGTPSLLTPAQVAGLVDAVAGRLGLAAGAEVTLEADPGPDEKGDLAGFRAAGVNRLSLGAQSMDAVELRRLGRRHAPADVVDAVSGARAAGFESVSLDLLTDVPGQSVASWERTLRATLDLAPDHLSVYALSLGDPDAEGLTGPDGDHLPVPRGARAWRDRARAQQSQERAARMESLTDELAAAAGLARYEIANLARPGHESRHNRLYWRRRPYLALGPGAHASDGALERTWNAARLDGYLGALAEGRLPPGGAERTDTATALAERAILGLRLSEGLGANVAALPGIAEPLDWAVEQGLVEVVDGRTRLTARGRLLADEVFVRLLPDAVPAAREPAHGAWPAPSPGCA
jgi:oxygen-independent coproporphyrinogen-3 oxidase